jgi:hypothetical protein
VTFTASLPGAVESEAPKPRARMAHPPPIWTIQEPVLQNARDFLQNIR